MKKLVCFTLAMVFVLAGVALAQPQHYQSGDEFNGNLSKNIVPLAVDDSVAVSANNNKVASPDIDVNGNKVRWESPDIKTGDVLSNNKVTVATGDAQQAGQVAAKNKAQVAIDGGINAKDNAKVGSNFGNEYIVDNTVLANVNVAASHQRRTLADGGGMVGLAAANQRGR